MSHTINYTQLRPVRSTRAEKRPRVISVASGKGGVGKTLTTVNLAIAARRMGYSVLVLDGDLGLANVDVVLGLKARYNINDVIEGTVELKDIILTGPLGIEVIPSGSGLARLADLSQLERLQLLDQLEAFNRSYDVFFIDTGAGISPNVLHLNAVSHEIIVVTTPEPHAMTDAYAFIKVMSEQYGEKSYSLIVNMVHSEEEGLKVSQRITDVARKFLDTKISTLGSIPFDPQMQKSVMMRRAASESSTYTIAGQSWNRISRQLFQGMTAHEPSHPPGADEGDRKFWRELVMTQSADRARSVV